MLTMCQLTLVSVEECKHIPLPASLWKEVQEKFAAGITIERIMDGKLL